MKPTFAAAVFAAALLAVTTPARAVMVDYVGPPGYDQWSLTNVNVVGTNISLTGFFDYDPATNPTPSAPITQSPFYDINVYAGGILQGTCRLGGGCEFGFLSSNTALGGSGGPPTGNFQLVGTDPFDVTASIIPLDSSASGFWYFAPLSHPISGSLTKVSPVPLPAALPLFGTAIAGLGGAGWWKRHRESRNRRA